MTRNMNKVPGILPGTLSFVAMGIRLPAVRRAVVALVFSVVGFVVALSGLHKRGEQVRGLPPRDRLLDRATAGRGPL